MNLKARAERIREDVAHAAATLSGQGWVVEDIEAAQSMEIHLEPMPFAGPSDNPIPLVSALTLKHGDVQLELFIRHGERCDVLSLSAKTRLGRLDSGGSYTWPREMLVEKLPWSVQSFGRVLRILATEVIVTLDKVDAPLPKAGSPPPEAA